MDELIAQVRDGRRRAIGRMITQVENSDAAARTAVTALYPDTGRAHIVGITGSPGSGKSTLVNEIARDFRQRQLSVGIVAIDPSSPFTGGALLGDRVRMRDLAGDDGIFIRSMASRGSLGGLARATQAVVQILDAAGFEVILIETVGAGQAEVDVARAAHTTVVVEAPGMGDDIQSIKAGILEIADVLVVNKADRPGTARTVKSLEMMLHLNPRGVSLRHHGRLATLGTNDNREPAEAEDGWDVKIYQTVATEGQGITALVDAIQEHADYLRRSDEWLIRERDRSRQEVEQLLKARFMAHLAANVSLDEQQSLIEAVARRQLDPYTAVARLFAQVAVDQA